MKGNQVDKIVFFTSIICVISEIRVKYNHGSPR